MLEDINKEGEEKGAKVEEEEGRGSELNRKYPSGEDIDEHKQRVYNRKRRDIYLEMKEQGVRGGK
uniref:Uncharacterized protein n=1 Tax=Nelumbo nucifera TaxID=4432 RepID=A0A822YC33_NELNU|nr:TPA_asm: hypothetical protein HUJ06_030549 [Nelumbo nucifera]